MSRFFLSLIAIAISSPAVAQNWGDLSLRIVYDSDKLPKPAAVAGAAGVPFCGGLGLKEDAVLVNPKDGGLANAFVYLFELDATKVAVHPSYAKSAKDEVQMANKGCAFVPKALGLRVTQQFIGANPDPVGHSMKLDPFNNLGFNLAVAAGGQIKPVLTKAEATPLEMSCTSHPWMKGLVLIREDPYFAVSDASGKVTIANLPAGKWSFRVWHEKIGFFSRNATLAGKPVDWPRGKIAWEIKPGKNDLGELLVKPVAFK
jgi:hypothetical protein